MLIGQQIGPFEIEKELGSGAMGTVYRAKFQRSADKVVPVALKVVAFGLLGNEGAMARFEREANILKQLKHPNIVRMIAHGKIKKTNPYIVMEYIDGEALDRVLARRGKLGWEEVLTYGRHLCDALQHAHDKGIIHRDLKPSNLMVTKEGVLKLTDFGIAKDADMTALTGANSTIGTAAYMSPEQCKGDRNLSNKSDLYSLGVVFFELLTGRKPFAAETTVEMFLKHVNEKAPRIGKQVNELPTKFESLILQLLEKDKDNRPVDASWVGRMLAEVEEDAYARKSAGLAVAEARTAKPTNQSGDRMDADDKAAARALRGKKKKAKKPVHVPLFERKWVRAAGIVAVLATMAVGVWQAVKAPSAASMYRASDAEFFLRRGREQRGRVKGDGIANYVEGVYPILAARLAPERADAILLAAMDRAAGADSTSRQARQDLAITMAQIGGEPAVARAVDWFFDDALKPSVRPGGCQHLLDAVASADPLRAKRLVARLIRDPRLDRLGPAPTAVLVDLAQGYLGTPLADETDLQTGRWADPPPDQPFAPLPRWRESLRRTVDDWAGAR